MYAFRPTEKGALQEIGSPFTLKLGSPRTGFPAVREFGEPSTKLDFGGFDDMMTDGERPEGKGTNQLPPEVVDEDGRGKRTRKMGSRNLSRGRKPNFQRLMNTNDNGR